MKAVGNIPIRLLSWEKYLLELLQLDENPTLKKAFDDCFSGCFPNGLNFHKSQRNHKRTRGLEKTTRFQCKRSTMIDEGSILL